jgi:hypothetical protein
MAFFMQNPSLFTVKTAFFVDFITNTALCQVCANRANHPGTAQRQKSPNLINHPLNQPNQLSLKKDQINLFNDVISCE